jgi:hypothetical protein
LQSILSKSWDEKANSLAFSLCMPFHTRGSGRKISKVNSLTRGARFATVTVSSAQLLIRDSGSDTLLYSPFLLFLLFFLRSYGYLRVLLLAREKWIRLLECTYSLCRWGPHKYETLSLMPGPNLDSDSYRDG